MAVSSGAGRKAPCARVHARKSVAGVSDGIREWFFNAA